jgi:PAP2 superfamily
MKLTTGLVVTGVVLAGLAGAARADVITEWNVKIVNASLAAQQPPPVQARNIAIVHLAMFDAVNAIEQRFTPYRVQTQAPRTASAVAAAAAAAHHVMARLYPSQLKDIDATLQATLASVPDGDAKTQGVQLGEKVAAALLQERGTDGANASVHYRPHAAPGTYVPTVFPVSTHWGAVKPFALKSGSQFRPSAPYALNSAQWAKDYAEIKRMGARNGSGRSAEQTDIARFWEFTGADTYHAPGRQIAAAKNLGLLENARLFALVSLATADAFVAIFDAKYAYNFWRPVTAIRNGDIDGNDATERDAAWEPFIPTPLHPEYPCAHCIYGASSAAVLSAVFGDAIPTVSMTTPTAPGVTRSFSRLSDIVTEVINARIYDGVHYRTSGEVGAEMGRKIADYVMQNFLRPVR